MNAHRGLVPFLLPPCSPAPPAPAFRRRCGHLHRQVSQSDHRYLLVLHPADQHRRCAYRQLRRPGGHRQPIEPRLQLWRQSGHRPPSASGSPHGMSRRCANPSAWYRSAVSIRPGIRRRKRCASRAPKAMATAAASTRRTSYVNPVMYWLEVVTDFPAWKGSFDPRLPHRGRSLGPTTNSP